jgi:FtsH-binding integral membrane protein
MTWQIIVILKMAGGSILAPLVFKLLGDAPTRERIGRITIQYAWASLLALMATLWIAGMDFQIDWKIAIVGALMPAGVFFQWRAYAWSLSRGVLFKAVSDILPFVLSAVMLGEWRVFSGNIPLFIGVGLASLGTALLFTNDIRAKKRREYKIPHDPKKWRAFYWNALASGLIFGLAYYLENYWAKTGVSVPVFLHSWYWAAFAGSIVLFAITRALPRTTMTAMSPGREQLLVALAGLAIFANLGLAFVAFQLVEQVVVLPVFAVADIILPAVVGMIVFGEWKEVRRTEWIYYAFALIGTLLIAVAR